MHLPPEQKPTIGYVVSTWPRLSQTFVLNEILALERRGLPVRIFSIKDPRGEPVHAKLAKVRAPVAYLSFRRHGRPILLSTCGSLETCGQFCFRRAKRLPNLRMIRRIAKEGE
ncbi:MAG: hypothetical protein DMG29_19445 [Acidobacteria bacterium]|nr:MAG: hypothetical protein DMG29_19445 [Acidobacteriota bacterium]